MNDKDYQDIFQIDVSPEILGVRMNENLIGTMRDISAKQGVQIQIQKDGLVLWVNVDGICIARIMMLPSAEIEIEDNRK